jgi:hypothetical protein
LLSPLLSLSTHLSLIHSLTFSLKGGCGIKVIFNALLKKYVKIEKINDKMLKLVCINVIADSAPSVDESADKAKLLPATFLLKTQLPSEADDLYNKIKSEPLFTNIPNLDLVKDYIFSIMKKLK